MPKPQDPDLTETLLELHQRAHAGWLGVEMTRITRAWFRGVLVMLAIACAAFLVGTLTTVFAVSIVSANKGAFGAPHALQLMAFGLGMGATWCLGLAQAWSSGWLIPAATPTRPTKTEHRMVGALATALMPYGASSAWSARAHDAGPDTTPESWSAHIHDAGLTVHEDALTLRVALGQTHHLALHMPRGEATDAVTLSLYGARAHHGAQPLPAPWEAAPCDGHNMPLRFTHAVDAAGAWRETLPGDLSRLMRALKLPVHMDALRHALTAPAQPAHVRHTHASSQPPAPPSASLTLDIHPLADALSAHNDTAQARREGVMLAWDAWTNFAIFACVMIVAVSSVALRFCLSAEPNLLGALMVAMAAGAFAVGALLWTWFVSPGRPSPRPLATRKNPTLTLHNGLLSAPDLDVVIDLNQPFEATLTRQPQPNPNPACAWVHLDLGQRAGPVGAKAQRLQLAFPAAPSAALDTLDTLAHVPVLIAAEDVATHLIPALAYYAALHGHPLPWRVDLAQDAQTVSPEAAPHRTSAVYATAARTSPRPGASDHEP